MQLNERIALARKQAGLSQEQLGEKLGVSRQAVSKWESGQTNPDVAYIIEMCRLLGVSSDWLLLGEESAGEVRPEQCPGCGAIVTPLDCFCPRCGRELNAPEERGYTILFGASDFSSYMTDDIYKLARALARSGWSDASSPLSAVRSPEDAAALAQTAPVILARGLSALQVQEALRVIIHESNFQVYPDAAGDTPQALAGQQPTPSGQFFLPRQPLSFGGVVGAVVVGIIVTVLLLSFL